MDRVVNPSAATHTCMLQMCWKILTEAHIPALTSSTYWGVGFSRLQSTAAGVLKGVAEKKLQNGDNELNTVKPTETKKAYHQPPFPPNNHFTVTSMHTDPITEGEDGWGVTLQQPCTHAPKPIHHPEGITSISSSPLSLSVEQISGATKLHFVWKLKLKPKKSEAAFWKKKKNHA